MHAAYQNALHGPLTGLRLLMKLSQSICGVRLLTGNRSTVGMHTATLLETERALNQPSCSAPSTARLTAARPGCWRRKGCSAAAVTPLAIESIAEFTLLACYTSPMRH